MTRRACGLQRAVNVEQALYVACQTVSAASLIIRYAVPDLFRSRRSVFQGFRSAGLITCISWHLV